MVGYSAWSLASSPAEKMASIWFGLLVLVIFAFLAAVMWLILLVDAVLSGPDKTARETEKPSSHRDETEAQRRRLDRLRRLGASFRGGDAAARVRFDQGVALNKARGSQYDDGRCEPAPDEAGGGGQISAHRFGDESPVDGPDVLTPEEWLNVASYDDE
jgi:hypothetical protein